MEDTLRVLRKFIIANGLKVLILVVMEDTLRERLIHDGLNKVSLNPCCNGRYSQSTKL